MSAHSADEAVLHRALELASEAIGLASPNPYVGAVIADAHGNLVGTGTYTYSGVKHAEILALEAAGSKARGGTLYINLEPHAHQGRTPPCTDALIAAGIHRVVASMPDPNPKVSGQGFEKLRAGGVHVEVGRLEEQARRLNEGFARYIRHGRPLVTLKAAMTLDGKIAPPPAEALDRYDGIPAGGWVTSEVARAHVQELRHQNDALVFCAAHDEQKKAQLEELGIRVETISSTDPDGRPDLAAILRRLGQLEITSVLIEGGATVNWTALASNVVDKVFLYYAPKILAGSGSIPFAAGVGFLHMSQAAQVKHIHLHRFGEDFAVEGYVRDPYGE